jgi:voltage-gated potassium channel
MKAETERHIFHYLLAATLLVITTGTIFYHFQEHFSWLNAYYFSVVTLATVGYGDLVPHTPLGKFFTTIYIFVGVGILTTFINYSLKRRANKKFKGSGQDE